MSELTTLMLASDEATMRRHIMLAPGALDDVPLVPLIQFLAEHGLELHGLTIERAEKERITV